MREGEGGRWSFDTLRVCRARVVEGGGTLYEQVASPSFALFVGAVRVIDILDAGRTAGVTVFDLEDLAVVGPGPGLLKGVLARAGTEPARVFRLPFSFSYTLLASVRICKMLSPFTRKGRPVSASQAGMDTRRSCSS